MAFAIIPLSMKAYVTATATSGDYTLYALKFVSNNEDEDDIEGVQAIYTAEDLQIPLISTQQTYGTYFNPIEDGDNYIFKAAYLGDKFTAVVAEDDTETLSGNTAMVFTNDNAEERLLPVVTSDDAGKTVVVNEDGEWTAVGDKLLPDVTAEDFNQLLQVNNFGKWTKSNIPLDLSRSTNYSENNLYLVKNDESAIRLARTDARVACYSVFPTALYNAINNTILPQITTLMQSKKWTVLTTNATDEESYAFTTNIGTAKLFFAGRTGPVGVAYQGSTIPTFNFYEFIPNTGGMLHTLVNCKLDTTPPTVNLTIFVRYEE